MAIEVYFDGGKKVNALVKSKSGSLFLKIFRRSMTV